MAKDLKSYSFPKLHKLQLKTCKASDIVKHELPKLSPEEIDKIKKDIIRFKFYQGDGFKK